MTQHNGSVTIPAAPERITALSNWDLDLLVSLDVAPVGAVLPLPPFAWIKNHPAIAGLTIMQAGAPGSNLPIEQVAATRPDLLSDVNGAWTGAPGREDQSATLNQIAPTLSAPTDPVADDWRARLRHLGRALDREEQAAAAIGVADEAIAAVARQHPQFAGKTVTFARIAGPEQVQLVVGEGDFTRQFLAEFGFRAPQAQLDALRGGPGAAGTVVAISLERLRLLDADVLIFGLGSEQLLAGQPAYQSLDVVRRGAALSFDIDRHRRLVRHTRRQPAEHSLLHRHRGTEAGGRAPLNASRGDTRCSRSMTATGRWS